MKQKIIFTNDIIHDVEAVLSTFQYDKIFVLMDSNTHRFCWDLLGKSVLLHEAQHIIIEPGDSNKNLNTLSFIWEELSTKGATRHSCLINLGGGMVTDIGGMASSTFKRGLKFINIPTTLLSMVDASVGGKTGINFKGVKNEIGLFSESNAVILHSAFLQTLPYNELLGGFAEMIKHALIDSEALWAETLRFDIENPNWKELLLLVKKNVEVKERIVIEDPKEQNIRKALNFGHTFAHAFEAWSISNEQELSHGFAVAYGIICELYLSALLQEFPFDKMKQTLMFIHSLYPTFPFACNDYNKIIDLMRHDKKNKGQDINFSLLKDIGSLALNTVVGEEDIKNALDFLRETN